MTTIDIQIPPAGVTISSDLKFAEVFLKDHVRYTDPENAKRAAAIVKAARKAACREVYDYVRNQWPSPVRGEDVVRHFLGGMRDPERRLRELRAGLDEIQHAYEVVNLDGTWSIRVRS